MNEEGKRINAKKNNQIAQMMKNRVIIRNVKCFIANSRGATRSKNNKKTKNKNKARSSPVSITLSRVLNKTRDMYVFKITFFFCFVRCFRCAQVFSLSGEFVVVIVYIQHKYSIGVWHCTVHTIQLLNYMC